MRETEIQAALHANGTGPEEPPLVLEEPPRRQGVRRGLIAAGLLAVLAMGGLGAWQAFAPHSTVPTASVRRGTIISTVQTTGKLAAQTVAQLGFRNGGRVVSIPIREGAVVTAGQVLATLDTESLARQVDEAQVNLDIARLRLKQAQDGPRPQEIAGATADLQAATARLDSARSGGRADDIAAAQAALTGALARLDLAKHGAPPQQIAAAQAGLDEAQANYNKVKAGPAAQDIAAAQATLRAAKAAQDKVKQGPATQDIAAAQAGVHEAQANLNTVKAGPSAQDIAAAQAGVRQAQANLNTVKAGPSAQDIAAAQAGVREAQANLNTVKAGPTTQDIAAAQARVTQAQANRATVSANTSNAKEQARLRWDQSANAVRNAQDIYSRIVDQNKRYGDNVPGAAQDAANKAQRDVEDAGTAMEQARLAYEAAKQDEITSLAQADSATAEAQAALDKLQAGTTADDITAAQSNVDKAQAALDKLQAGATADDIAAAQSNVDKAQAALDKLQAGATADDIAAAQSNVDKAQAALDKLQAGATPADLTAAQTDVDKAQAALDKLQAGATPADLAAAQASVDRARAQLNDLKAGPQPAAIRDAQAAVDQARANLDKVTQGASPQEIAQAQAQVDAAQAALDLKKAGSTATDLDILQAQIRLSELSVASAQAQLADAQLLAPFAGTILAINVKEGEQVGGQAVIQLADLRTLRVEADIDEIDVGRVTSGQPVTVTLDAYPGQKLPGSIETLAVGATQKQGSTVYKATIAFTAGADVQPRAGMAADVLITAERKDNALLVPSRALETIGSSQFVTIQDAGDAQHKVKVDTGLANTQDTEIIDDGSLRDGQTVVLH